MDDKDNQQYSQDLAHLIYLSLQFGWRGETDLKLPELQRLESRGWIAEGEENGEYDITEAGRALIDARLARKSEEVSGDSVRIACAAYDSYGSGVAETPAMRAAMTADRRNQPAQESVPIPMILHCPSCRLQHIDEPGERTEGWDNPPHRSHLCHGCGTIWRPADIPTAGVSSIKTKGKEDRIVPAEEKAETAVKPRGYLWRRHGRDKWSFAEWIPISPDEVAEMRSRDWEVIELYSAPPAERVRVPDGWRDDVALAAQMLTWGADEGLTESQERDVRTHQSKLFAMLSAAPEASSHG